MTEVAVMIQDLKGKAQDFANQDFESKFMKWQFGARQQADFIADLVKLLDDGVQIRSAMAFMADNTKPPKSLVAKSVLNALESGDTLADGFAGWFPLEAVEAIRAGEASGDVRGALRSVAASLEKKAGLGSLVAGELVYPTILLAQGVGILGYIGSESIGFFQTIAQMLPRERWPSLSLTIESLSDLVRGYWFLIPILVFGVVAFLRAQLTNHVGPTRERLDKWPLFSTYRRMVTSDFLSSLSLMLGNGVKLKGAINLLERNATPYLASHIARMRVRLEQGTTNMGAVLNTGMLDDELMKRLELLAGARNVHETIESLGVRSGETAMKHIKATLFVIKMLMLFSVVACLGSTITAVYSLTNAMQ